MGRWGRLVAVFCAAAATGAAACGGGGPTTRAIAATSSTWHVVTTMTSRPSTTTTAAPTTTTTAAPTTTTAPPVTLPPKAAVDPVALAQQIVAAERAVRDPATPAPTVAAMAWQEQVAYRALGAHPEWDPAVLANVPAELVDAVQKNVDARRQFRGMVKKIPENLPPWRIVDPRPADELLADYQDAERQFGVPWQYLAAINLVETGMGRIDGLSVAGAQGPMQFMPSTWAAFGAGGDVHDPHDAILGAARYLVHNGFTQGNVDGALFRYNNHPNYVRGVVDYAQVMQADPRAYYGFYNWQIYYATVMGDVLLPVGYESPNPIPVADYLATHPQ
jgi:membrane-bound lytic murein transglycosylase B